MLPVPTIPSRPVQLGVVGAFVVIALLVYGVSLRNGFVHWDDGLLIYQNPAVVNFSWNSIKHAFTTYDPELYIPLTLLSYQLDYLLGGGSAFPFHVQSLLLHILNAVFVCWLALLCIRHRVVAVIIGLLFLMHPLHTEAVAWASGRKDLLSTFFFLGALLSFVYSTEREDRRLYVVSLLLFALGLMSKVMILTLPAVLVLILLREQGKVTRGDLVRIAPYGVLSVIFGIVALFGKTEVSAASTLMEKILMAAKSSIFYLQKLFIPLDLSVVYPHPEKVMLSSPDIYIPVIILAVLVVCALWSLRYTRDIVVWLAFYCITLSPTFINIAKGADDLYAASDRYAYIPSIGIFFVVGYVLREVLVRPTSMQHKKRRTWAVAGVSSVVLVVLGALASSQSRVWKSTRSLFEHAIAHAPAASYVAHANLGNAYRQTGEYEKAIEQFEMSLAIKPHARTYANLGAVYRRMGQYAQAEQAYTDALMLNSGSALAYYGLGIVHADQGQYTEALVAYDTALEHDPSMAAVYVNKGVLYAQQNRVGEAIASYNKAIQLQPLLTEAYYNLAVLHAELAQYDDAVSNYKKVLERNPRSIAARINLGLLYARQQKKSEAVEQFQKILDIDPGNRAAISALNQLGVPAQ